MNINQNALQGATALSPFLPGTQIQYAWDSTSLGLLKTCPRLYYFTMIDGWTTKEESLHLRFGIEFHQAMHDYEIFKANGLGHEDAVRDVVHALLIRAVDFNPKEEEVGNNARYKSKDNLVRLVIWYLDHFKNDACETYILENGKPAVELSFKFELDWGPKWGKDLQGKAAHTIAYTANGDVFASNVQPYLLCGHLDRVVNFNGDLYFMDYKTAKSTPGSYFFDQFNPNNQMSLYVFAAQVILKSPIRGGIINAIQCSIDYSYMKDHPPFQRGFTYRSKETIEEWIEDLADWLEKAEGYAVRNRWPKNDTACSMYGGCRFRDVCSKSPQVRDRFLNSNFIKLPEHQKWNPMASR